jgi:hypothetical protein
MAAQENAVRIMQWPEQLKVCVSVCEPICAQSEYTVSVDIFDRPVATITVRGTTRVFNCSEKIPSLK